MSSESADNLGRIGNRLLALEKRVNNELSELRQALTDAYGHFEGLDVRAEVREGIGAGLEPDEYDAITYSPVPDKFSEWADQAEKDIAKRLPNLTYIGEDEDGVPLVADFEVKIRLPALYLAMGRRAKNRYEWLKENPYEEWRKQWLK